MTNPASTKNGKEILHSYFDSKRSGVILAILLGACVLPATGASAAGCNPGSEEVSFFQHSNYKGACSVLAIGKYPNSTALRVRNDSISSIKVGSRVTVTVCKHATVKITSTDFFKKNPQKCQTFKNSISSFKNQRIGNDSISSAWIFKPIIGYNPTKGRCKPSSGQEAVAVYQDANYKGFCRLLYLGDYRNSKEMNFKNDSISSIEFGSNSKAYITVCQHSNLQGRCENITASVSSLYNSKVGDNQITSIRVGRRPGATPNAPATPNQGVVLGGVNLTAWCAKQFGNGFKAKLVGKTAGDWTCERSAGDRRPILVKSACKLQYGNKAYKAKALNWNDPLSWKCFAK
jgi:hypothetical protein